MLRPRLANVSLHHCKDGPGRYVPIRQDTKQPTYRIVSPTRRSTLSPLASLDQPTKAVSFVSISSFATHRAGIHSTAPNNTQFHSFQPKQRTRPPNENCRRLFHFSSLRSDIFSTPKECHLRPESNCHRPTVSLCKQIRP